MCFWVAKADTRMPLHTASSYAMYTDGKEEYVGMTIVHWSKLLYSVPKDATLVPYAMMHSAVCITVSVVCSW